MDFLIVIGGLAVVWALFALICVGLCVSAARGDRALRAPAAGLPGGSAPRRFAGSFRPAA